MTRLAEQLIDQVVNEALEYKPFTKPAKPSTLLGTRSIVAYFDDKESAADARGQAKSAKLNMSWISAPYEEDDGRFSIKFGKPPVDQAVKFVDLVRKAGGEVGTR